MIYEITLDLVSTLPDAEDRQDAQEKLHQLGYLIGPEWAKSSRHRVINTWHLGIWGDALNRSIMRKEQLLVLDKVSNDVTTLLNGGLHPQQITANRYYEPEPFDISFD